MRPVQPWRHGAAERITFDGGHGILGLWVAALHLLCRPVPMGPLHQGVMNEGLQHTDQRRSVRPQYLQGQMGLMSLLKGA